MMRKQLGLPFVTVALAAGLGNMSCARVECGTGTVERDGECVLFEDNPGSANCAPGTVLGPMGCEVETPTQCDPMTTREEFDEDTGITTCVGVGGDGCSAPLPCATPDGTHVSVCGNIYDAQTDLKVAATGAIGTACDPGNPSADGPCALDLKFYDALDFAQNPDTAQPLAPQGGVYLDDCGRYRGEHIAQPTFGFIGVAVQDATGRTGHRRTGVATANNLARPATGFRAYATRVETDMLWTTQANLTGMTFSQRGVLAIVFRHNGMTIPGVQVQRENNNIPNDDFYFSDNPGPGRSMLDPARTNTGPNGTVLVINSPVPIAHDGAGGEPAGCQWPTNLAASIMGVTFVQLKEAEMPGGAPCQ